MIVEAILDGIVFVLLGVISLFPTIPALDLSFLDGVFQMLSLLDMFVSLQVLSVCLVVVFVTMNARVIWSIVMWVVRKIPGIE